MTTLRVAVIGCGYWGPNLIRNFERSGDAEIRWICDKDPARMERVAEEFHLDTLRTQDYRDLLNDPLLDAVAIATPVATHYRIARDTLKAGKHTLVEKPLARTSGESRELVELAEAGSLILMVDHTFLFSPPVMELKQIIRNGDFGRILYVHSTRLNLGLFQEDINVLWDLLPHDLSIVDDLLNTHPLEVSAQGAANIDPRYEDVAFVTVYYENGLLAHFHVSWLDPCKTRRMTLVGDNKMAVYDDMDSNEPIRIYDKRVSRLPYFTDFGEFKLHYRFGDIHSPRIQMTEPLKRVCSHFLESIQKGTTPQSDGRTGLRIVRVLEAAEESLAHRGRIQRIQPE